MVEDQFGLEVADTMIERACVSNGGAYTAVGTYDHHEILRMITELSASTGIGASALVRAFGEHLFGRFAVMYERMVAGSPSALDFLAGIESRIHKEVLKLYPEAELPRFECRFLRAGCLEMVYDSTRPFADLAEGLIQGCAHHFHENIEIQREDVSSPSGFATRFTVTAV